MSTYSMAQVEVLTGIKAHTLRVWEKRFNLLEPLRTATNIRFYSDEQLIKLVNVGILLRNGHKISWVDKMSMSEIENRVKKILHEPTDNNEDVQGLTLAMIDLNEADFDTILKVHLLRKGLLFTIIDLIYPFLHHVGILWNTRKALPAQEHFISNLIRKKIISSIDAMPSPAKNAPRILMYLMEGEHHEIGLLVAHFIAADLGYKVYYLGQNVPSENILEVMEISKADLVMTMFLTPKQTKVLKHIEKVIKNINKPLLISCNLENFNFFNEYDNVNYLKDPQDFISFLTDFKTRLEA